MEQVPGTPRCENNRPLVESGRDEPWTFSPERKHAERIVWALTAVPVVPLIVSGGGGRRRGLASPLGQHRHGGQ